MAAILAVVAALVTAVAVPPCIMLAHHFGVIDRPGPLKTHQAPVPYLGGVAVFAGVLVGESVGRPITLIPIALALAVGVADDRFGLPASLRLVAQLAVGVTVAVTVPVHLPAWIGLPLIVAGSVVLINGFNLLDGLDMLASGVAAAAAVGFAVVTHGSSRLLAASLTGALVAFLWYNRPPARIYLGDGGSYLLGAVMTVLLAYAWGDGVATSTGIIALSLLVVPVAEVLCAVVRRGRSGHTLLAGDRSHPYDLLVRRGWSRTSATATYVLLEAIIAVVVIIVVRVGDASVGVAVWIDVLIALLTLVGAGIVGGMSKSAGTPA